MAKRGIEHVPATLNSFHQNKSTKRLFLFLRHSSHVLVPTYMYVHVSLSEKREHMYNEVISTSVDRESHHARYVYLACIYRHDEWFR